MVETSTLLSSLVASQVKGRALNADDLRAALALAEKRSLKARIYELEKARLAMRVYVTNSKGIVVFDSDGGRDEGKDYSRWNDVYLTLQGKYGARATREDPQDPDSLILYVASPIEVGDERLGVLTVCKPAGTVALFQETARRKIIFYGILLGVIVIVLGMVSSFWITSPIEKLTGYAKAIRDGKRPAPPKLGRSEIGTLGEAFEEMRDALEGKQYVENYVQTLTHEMKSPLSAIRGAAELMEEDMDREQRRRFLNNIRTEANRIQNLIDRLLLLSALESRKELRDVERVDFSELVREILESLVPQVQSKRVSVSSKLNGPIMLEGERFFLRQAVANLLQNAVEFTPPRGSIQVALDREDGKIALEVRDTGPGVPDFALRKVFDRFYSLTRPDTGRKSSGLGLTFVREVALLHKGDVRLENCAGGGARAILHLPACGVL